MNVAEETSFSLKNYTCSLLHVCVCVGKSSVNKYVKKSTNDSMKTSRELGDG